MKPFAKATAIILAMIAVVHALRLGLGWSVTVNAIDIPMWASALGIVVAGWLATGLWREGRTQAPGGGITLAQLTQLLDLNQGNQGISIKNDLLTHAFPPDLKDEHALEQLRKFAKDNNCSVSVDEDKELLASLGRSSFSAVARRARWRLLPRRFPHDCRR